MGSPRVLRIDAACEREVRAHSCEGYPHETCGILLGVPSEDGAHARIARRARNLNVERARDRYDMDPAAQLAAEGEARRLGLEVVGYYHSHPDHPAAASATDAALAWPGYHYVICAVSRAAGGAPSSGDLRAWWFEERGGAPRESRVEVVTEREA